VPGKILDVVQEKSADLALGHTRLWLRIGAKRVRLREKDDGGQQGEQFHLRDDIAGAADATAQCFRYHATREIHLIT